MEKVDSFSFLQTVLQIRLLQFLVNAQKMVLYPQMGDCRGPDSAIFGLNQNVTLTEMIMQQVGAAINCKQRWPIVFTGGKLQVTVGDKVQYTVIKMCP